MIESLDFRAVAAYEVSRQIMDDSLRGLFTLGQALLNWRLYDTAAAGNNTPDTPRQPNLDWCVFAQLCSVSFLGKIGPKGLDYQELSDHFLVNCSTIRITEVGLFYIVGPKCFVFPLNGCGARTEGFLREHVSVGHSWEDGIVALTVSE